MKKHQYIKKTDAINQITQETIVYKKHLPSLGYSKELIELLYKQPFCKKIFNRNGIAKRQTVTEYLQELEKIEGENFF